MGVNRDSQQQKQNQIKIQPAVTGTNQKVALKTQDGCVTTQTKKEKILHTVTRTNQKVVVVTHKTTSSTVQMFTQTWKITMAK
jgi:hypothetical protein